MTPLPLAAARADRLRRGINLSHWFSQIYWQPGYSPAHFDTYIRASDFALIRDMGFDHVRFPVNCEPIMAAMMAPALEPEITRGSRSCSCSALHTPMWKRPSVAPPESMSAGWPKLRVVPSG